ncbi:Uncharacterized protein TXXE_03315 [Thermobacillus xylanilyticus]|uniref:Uncharacterized protein n=1 Tax=Thermobacillus xylanilyticus TaxID=76633 RepID=A0ABM8V0R4_THEXY|nr:Uncharacterized protein TXXE_03315 [Thermobacillus xylanilyticus]
MKRSKGVTELGGLMFLIALGLTGYSLAQAWRSWRGGNAAAGLGIALLSGCFLPLAIYLMLRD